MMDKYDERLVRAVTFERDQWQKEVNALRSELVQWRELHRVIAEELTGGLGWPDHGNAALAIAATFMLHKQRLEKAEAERDALRQVVAAADAMRRYDSYRMPGEPHWQYDVARAAIKEQTP